MLPSGGASGTSCQSRISGSQTTPQLCHYTRQDIQEQYLSTKSVRREQVAAAKGRARSSGDSGRLENENEDEELQDESAAAGHRKRRRRRARSASIFSKCFSIPNISSMLSSRDHQQDGTQRLSRRRMFLAHLGLAGNSQQQHQSTKKRPLSASQTAGNLQQVAADDEMPTHSMMQKTNASSSGGKDVGGRKHVSFGAHQQEPNVNGASVTDPAAASKSGAPDFIPEHRQQQQHIHQAKQARLIANPTADQCGRSNVIIRNYQPNISAYHKPTASAGPAKGDSNQQASKQSSPIYLVSIVPNNGANNNETAIKTARAASANQAAGIYHNHQAIMRHSQQQQQQKGSTHQPPLPPPKGAAFGLPPNNAQQHLHQCSQVPAKPATIYKRLPSVPMRTQATQTEITAYHLMATPSLSSGSPQSQQRRRQRAEPEELASPPSGQRAICKRETGSQLEDTPRSSGSQVTGGGLSSAGEEPSSIGGDNYGKVASPATTSAAVAGKNSVAIPSQSARVAMMESQPQLEPSGWMPSDCDDDDDDDDDAELDARARGGECCGNLDASTLATSSSCSSESVSLVGHDSTLMAAAATDDEDHDGDHPIVPDVAASIMICDNEPGNKAGAAVASSKLKNDNNNKLPAPIVPSADLIEPPGQFKDTSLGRKQRSDESERTQSVSASAAEATEAPASIEAGDTTMSDKSAEQVGAAPVGGGATNEDADENDDEAPSLSEASSQTHTDTSLAARIIELGRALGGQSSAQPARRPLGKGRPKWASVDTNMTTAPAGAHSSSSSQITVANQPRASLELRRPRGSGGGDQLIRRAAASSDKEQRGGSGTAAGCYDDHGASDDMERDIGGAGSERHAKTAAGASERRHTNRTGCVHQGSTSAAAAGGNEIIMDDDNAPAAAASAAGWTVAVVDPRPADDLLNRQEPLAIAGDGEHAVKLAAQKRRDDFLMLADKATLRDSSDDSGGGDFDGRETIRQRAAANDDDDTANDDGDDDDDRGDRPAPPTKVNESPSRARRADAELEQICEPDAGASSLSQPSDNQPNGSPPASLLLSAAAAAAQLDSQPAATGHEEPAVGDASPLGQVGADWSRTAGSHEQQRPVAAGDSSAAAVGTNGADSSRGEGEAMADGPATIKRDYNGPRADELGAELASLVLASGAHKTAGEDGASNETQPASASLEDEQPDVKSSSSSSSAAAVAMATSKQEEQPAAKSVRFHPAPSGGEHPTETADSSSAPQVGLLPQADARDGLTRVGVVERLATEDEEHEDEDAEDDERMSCTGLLNLVDGGAQLAGSPPTTVSELDLDEELSTPSFVETYRSRLALAQQLADSLVCELMSECLVVISAERDTREQVASSDSTAIYEPDRVKSSSSQSSSTSTSSTSVSQHSRPCCHSKRVAHRPALPEKPAHLKQAAAKTDEKRAVSTAAAAATGHPEAAAAIAITATSLAAAAARHSGYSSSSNNNSSADIIAGQAMACPVSEACVAQSDMAQVGDPDAKTPEVATEDAETDSSKRSVSSIEQQQQAETSSMANVSNETELEKGDIGNGSAPIGGQVAEPATSGEQPESADGQLAQACGSCVGSTRTGSEASSGSTAASQSGGGSSSSSTRNATLGSSIFFVSTTSSSSVSSPTWSPTSHSQAASGTASGGGGGAAAAASQQAHSSDSSQPVSLQEQAPPVDDGPQLVSDDAASDTANTTDPAAYASQARRPSVELSTVSEVSEEMSGTGQPASSAAHAASSQVSTSDASGKTKSSRGSGLQRLEQQEQVVSRGPVSATQSADGNRSSSSGSRKDAGSSKGESVLLANEAALDQEGTEQDLTHSEYTLRSQESCDLAAQLTTASTPPPEDSCSAAGSIIAGGNGASSSSSCGVLQRRPSGQSQSRSQMSSTPPPPANGHSKAAGAKLLSGIDCPYVPDILPLSLPPPFDKNAQAAQAAAAATTAAATSTHRPRLSHDDTMEAIEDDVEGEEQELRQLEQVLDIAPPPAFDRAASNDMDARSCATPANESIKEEDDDMMGELDGDLIAQADDDGAVDVSDSDLDEDEESSISVSQQHGIVVSQETTATASPSPCKHDPLSRSATPTNSPSHSSRSEQVPADTFDSPAQSTKRSSVGQSHQFGNKPDSVESATNAILEHLSCHHPELSLEEPDLALEQSGSLQQPVDEPATGGGSSRDSCSPSRSSPSTVDASGQMSSTGTMKRRQVKRSDSPQVADDHENVPEAPPSPRPPTATEKVCRGRGPPLGQTKAPPTADLHDSRQQSSDLGPIDSSICSSCSCQEPEVPVVVEQASQEQAGGEAIKVVASTSRGQQQQQPTWMSHDEGTVFTENYWLAHWLYISEHEESAIWRRAIDLQQQEQRSSRSSPSEQRQVVGMPKNMNEISSTSSERNFSTRYKSTTRKMIHRRATIEMYKRMQSNSLRKEKRVEISRSNGEFGFRIHGSRPVVVSAIERGTSAETCGLQVGDLIYAINGTDILEMAHSDVVKLAHSADPSSLVLDLVPTNDFLNMSRYNRAINKRYEPAVTGYLMRLSPSTAQPLLIELQDEMSRAPGVSSQQRASKLNEVMRLAWRKRYFVLRSDNCLYWFESEKDIEPYGGINLQGFSASLTNEFSEPSYVIRLAKYGGQPHYLGTNNICDIQTWVDAINKAATEANQSDPYMKRSLTLARGKPNEIPDPDCCGHLYRLSHKRNGGSHWRAAYFVLKDACLYLFRDHQPELVSQASAVYYLHGYRVRNKHIEHKKYTFELIPPNRKSIKSMFLMANSETDRRRWIAALEYSIDRWIEID